MIQSSQSIYKCAWSRKNWMLQRVRLCCKGKSIGRVAPAVLLGI
jgi:hypothetical protein